MWLQLYALFWLCWTGYALKKHYQGLAEKNNEEKENLAEAILTLNTAVSTQGIIGIMVATATFAILVDVAGFILSYTMIEFTVWKLYVFMAVGLWAAMQMGYEIYSLVELIKLVHAEADKEQIQSFLMHDKDGWKSVLLLIAAGKFLVALQLLLWIWF